MSLKFKRTQANTLFNSNQQFFKSNYIDNSHLYNQNDKAIIHNQNNSLSEGGNKFAFVYNNDKVYKLPIQDINSDKEMIFNNIVNEVLSTDEMEFRNQAKIEGAMKQLDTSRLSRNSYINSNNNQFKSNNFNFPNEEIKSSRNNDYLNKNFYYINNTKGKTILPEPSDIDKLDNEEINYNNSNRGVNYKYAPNIFIGNQDKDIDKDIDNDVSADEIDCLYTNINRFDKHNEFD